MTHDLDHALEHFRVLEIEIDLIMTEGTPDMALALGRLDLSQQRGCARTHHVGQILIR